MKNFEHIDATSVEEAVSALSQYGGKASIIAGGSDIIGSMKDEILPDYPEALVNIKTIPGLNYIREEGGMLKIGALASLQDIAEDATVKGKYGSLATAASKAGSPGLRAMGTIGGNLCQECRCWYLRAPRNYFYCFRKGGTLCNAMAGDNRYNAIVGGQVCFAVCPSDTAIPLTALDATIVTSKRNIAIGDFFEVLGNVLDEDEIVTEIQVPEPDAGTKQNFMKRSVRKAIDFAISSVAVAVTLEGGVVADARVVLGGVAPGPYRATDAEDALKGNAISESVAAAAGVAAVKNNVPLIYNKYKIPLTEGLVKQALLAL